MAKYKHIMVYHGLRQFLGRRYPIFKCKYCGYENHTMDGWYPSPWGDLNVEICYESPIKIRWWERLIQSTKMYYGERAKKEALTDGQLSESTIDDILKGDSNA